MISEVKKIRDNQKQSNQKTIWNKLEIASIVFSFVSTAQLTIVFVDLNVLVLCGLIGYSSV